jgi:hypothetical protein
MNYALFIERIRNLEDRPEPVKASQQEPEQVGQA